MTPTQWHYAGGGKVTPSQWHNAANVLGADIVTIPDVVDAAWWYAMRRRPHWLGLKATRRFHPNLKNLKRVDGG